MRIGLSHFGCRRPDHVAGELAELRREGVDFLVFAVTENDLLFHEETVRSIFDSAQQEGIEIWADPWGLAGIISGETPSWFLLYHPETWQVRADGERVPHACPNAPAVRDLFRRWNGVVARAGAQWVLWDEPHWAVPGGDYWPTTWPSGDSAWACRCEHCRAGFEQQCGYPMPANLTEDVRRFQEDSICSFLNELSADASSHGLQNAICWVPPEQLAGGLALETAASLPSMELLSVDPYWQLADRTVEDFFVPNVEHAQTVATQHGKPLQVWLQGFRTPKGREDELLDGLRALKRLGIGNVAIWHHNGMSALYPEDLSAYERVLTQILKEA